MSEYTKDRPVESLAFTAGAVEIEGLKEIRIVPDGKVESTAGEFILDREGAAEIIEVFEKHGAALPIDFEHQTLGGKYAAPDGLARAAGWIEKLFYESGRGLQALVRWNDRTRESLRSGEYRYISPVLQVRTDDRRAVALHSAGLTNKPAIPRMERLAASTRLSDMEILAMAENGEQTKNVAVPLELMRRLRDALGLGKDATVDVVMKSAIEKLQGKSEGEGESKDAAVAASVRERLGLEPNADGSEVTLALSILQGEGNAQTELAAMKQTEAERMADERIDLLCQENVLNYNNRAQIMAARSLALEDPGRFEALVGRMKPFVQPGRTTAPPRAGVGGKSRHTTIANAVREFAADESCRKLTTLRAFVDLRLRETGLGKMNDDESAEHAA